MPKWLPFNDICVFRGGVHSNDLISMFSGTENSLNVNLCHMKSIHDGTKTLKYSYNPSSMMSKSFEK